MKEKTFDKFHKAKKPEIPTTKRLTQQKANAYTNGKKNTSAIIPEKNQRERQTDRQRQRQTDRQTDRGRQTDRQTETETETDRQKETDRKRQTDREGQKRKENEVVIK